MWSSKKEEETAGWFKGTSTTPAQADYCSKERLKSTMYGGITLIVVIVVIFTFAIGIKVQAQLFRTHFKKNDTDVLEMAPKDIAYENFSNEVVDMGLRITVLQQKVSEVTEDLDSVTYRSEAFENKLKHVDERVITLNTDLAKFYAKPPSCDSSEINGIQTTTQNIEVFCYNKWRVFQRNTNSDSSFDRNWEDFEDGFGKLSENFWLGLSTLERLTKQKTCKLKIFVWDKLEKRTYAEYSSFYIDGPTEQYKLHISGYSGTAGDGLLGGYPEVIHDNMKFTTKNKDYDNSILACQSLVQTVTHNVASRFSDVLPKTCINK